MMLSSLKIKIAAKMEYYLSKNDVSQFDSNGLKRIFLIDTPSHGNLGDHAIALAELAYLEYYYPDYKVIEICEDDFNRSILALKKCIREEDIIFLCGGGNLGNRYMLDEIIRRKTIIKLKNNRIIIFPQTIDFSKNFAGFVQLQISRLIYGAHSNLTICTREEKSYFFAKKNFRHNTILVAPDMALFLSPTLFSKKTHSPNIKLFLRNDHEVSGNLNRDNIINKILCCAEKIGLTVAYSDTTVKEQVSPNDRMRKLCQLFNEYRASDLIVTDRLHGMILATVSGTFCIALPNSNNKIKGVYSKWLTNYQYIKYCDTEEDALQTISEIEVRNLRKYAFSNDREEFDRLYTSTEKTNKWK